MASSAECTGQNQQLLAPGGQMALPSSMGYGGLGGTPYGNYPSSNYPSSNYPYGNYTDVQRLNGGEPGANWGFQRPLPPEPLTEFQKFVASTTGQILPVYGASLFSHVPSTFAPVNMAPVPLDYVLGPGDELRVRVWGQVNFQANLRVDRSGDVFLPQIGPVHVEGLPVSQLDGRLRAAIRRVYHNFDLTADVGQTRAIQVYVTGEARRPGVYTVSSLSTLVDALFASGGPSLQGSMRHIELRRGDKLVTEFDLYALIARGDKSKDAKLLPGDVIYIPPVGPEVALTGSVRNPGIYELRSKETLAGLIADAGGVSSVASEARVSIDRVDDHNARMAMEVAYDKTGLATPLDNGDIIRVFPILPAYRKTVILRGNTANPGRFAWHPGMRISDLIPDKDSLITRNYWWRRAQLGLPAPEFEPIPQLAGLKQPRDGFPVKVSSAATAGSALNQSSAAAAAALGQNQSGDAQKQSDAGPSQKGSASDLTADQRAGGTSLAYAQRSSGSQNAPFPQLTKIQLLAPEIDWNYAAIERLDPNTLKTKIIPFDLGRLVLQHDASQDLKLEPGDIVTIFSDADIQVPLAQQTKLVSLEGEFVHAGTYSVRPGETLQELVKRAGGFTSDAYLYGSEFTRESTRKVQQARIDEYVQNLSMRMQQASLALASSGTASPQDFASASAAQGSEQALLASLSKIRATGRIVLQFTPGATGVSTLPNLPLENGDRFIVPPIPGTVNVVGAVYDQSSFLYKHGLRTEAYLRRAGGPTRNADWKHEFIIRADGEVVSRDTMGMSWMNGFGKLEIYPGDTIVVPEKTYKLSPIRGLIDWSQIFSQLAFGAAAINVLK